MSPIKRNNPYTGSYNQSSRPHRDHRAPSTDGSNGWQPHPSLSEANHESQNRQHDNRYGDQGRDSQRRYFHPVNLSRGTGIFQPRREDYSNQFNDYKFSRLPSFSIDHRLHVFRENIDGLRRPGRLNPSQVGFLLYELRHVTNPNREQVQVRSLLALLAPKIADVLTQFNAKNVGNALYGLKNLSDCDEIRAVLKNLAPKIPDVNEAFTGQGIGNALYGLKNLSDCDEVRAVLNNLALKIPDVKDAFTDQWIGIAVCGLACLSSSQESRAILDRLLKPLSEALKNQRFCTGKIVHTHFFKWLNPPSHLPAKLAFLAHIRSPEETWSHLARCLKPSEFRALEKIEVDRSDPDFAHVQQVLDTIRNSTVNPVLMRLKQLASPTQQIDRLLGPTEPQGTTDETLLCAAIEEVQACLEETPFEPNGVPNPKLAIWHDQIIGLQRKLPPALTMADLKPRCLELKPPQEIWLGPPPKNPVQQHDLVIALPTRGDNTPDVPVAKLLQSLDESLTAAKNFRSDQSVLLVLGINGKGTEHHERKAIDAQSKKVTDLLSSQLTRSGYKNKIQIKLLTFAWMTDQRNGRKQVIPFGTIRNHCFDHAMQGMGSNSRFISMDGDTTLTGPALDLIMNLQPLEATTLAYNLPSSLQDKHASTVNAFKLHWNIQAKVNTKIDSQQSVSLAYPAEPCLGVGSAGLAHLKKLHSEGKEIYGPTDCEGRFLMRHLSSLEGQKFLPVDANVVVDFHNFRRFEVQQHTLLAREDLIRQLSAYAGQSQNMSNLDFFTRQLAFGLSVHDASVRLITKHFYFPMLMKEGFELKQLQELSKFDPKTAQTAQALGQDPLMLKKLKDILEGYQQAQVQCGEAIADVVLDNAKKWIDAVRSCAVETVVKNKDARNSMQWLQSPQVQQQEPVIMNAARSQDQGMHVPPPYVRWNKDPRLNYPRASNEAPLSSLKQATITQAIPRKIRRQVGQGDVGEARTAQVMTTVQRDVSPQGEARGDVDGQYQTAFNNAGGLFRDMLSLLEPRHFGETRTMGLSEIKQEFRQRVRDQVGSGQISDQEMTVLVKRTLSDLLHHS